MSEIKHLKKGELPMELSRAERWILSNQYRILEALYPEEAEDYAHAREAVERGYELHYDSIAQYIDEDVTTVEECKEVLDILTMFSCLKRAYETLPDKSGIEEWAVRVVGFGGNDEPKQVGYARYFCDQPGGRFAELDRGKDNFNTHAPTLPWLRLMLSEWARCENKHHLTKEDIVRITSARLTRLDQQTIGKRRNIIRTMPGAGLTRTD